MLQFVAVCCSLLQLLQYVAVCRSVLLCGALCYTVFHGVAVFCSVSQVVACVAVPQVWAYRCVGHRHSNTPPSHVLQSVAVCCSLLQCVAECFSVLQSVSVCCRVFQCVAECFSVLQSVSVCCSVGVWDTRRSHTPYHMCCDYMCCSVLQHVAVCCSMLQRGSVWACGT